MEKWIIFSSSVREIKDEHTGKALKNYLKILEGKEEPKFKRSNLEDIEKEAFKIIEKCELCERKCRVNRLKGDLGYCRAPNEMLISSVFPHYGEEYFFIPSLTVFFMGCTFSCVFCQNWEVSQWYEIGKKLTAEELAKIIDNMAGECKNINFVGGEPTPYLPWIIKTLRFVKSSFPVIWNSNFYMSSRTMNILKDIVDVYLSDWKYGNDSCAQRLSNSANYSEIMERNHEIAFKNGEIVIRHLVLPGHIECCTKPALEKISSTFGDKVIVNIMDQYHPEWKAKNMKELTRRPTLHELNSAYEYAEKLGLNWIK